MSRNWRTTLLDPTPRAPSGFTSLATPVFRGSTTLFRSAAAVLDDWDQSRAPYAYGLYGTPTTFELGARLAALERGTHCFITPGGQAAIALISLAFARAGSHVLISDSVYGPNRQLFDRLLSRFDVEAEYYEPGIGREVQRLFRSNTRLIWCESPGSVTMEVQDVPAIAQVASAAGVITALDNTYAAGVYFDAFAAGVDITMQALTKYIGGHSDLLLGSVTVKREELYQALGDTHQLLGMGVSPDDCSLALRGLQTLGVRLEQLQASTLSLARWLVTQPTVARVLHPALPGSPGHELWQRDFTGSTSVFSVLFKESIDQGQLVEALDALQLFRIGYSWGGVNSLVMPYFQLTRQFPGYSGHVVRFNIGLESADDLRADLQQALARLSHEGS